MCDPVSAVVGGLQVVGGIAEGRAARGQARANAAHSAAVEANRHQNYALQIDYQQRLAEFQENQYLEYGASVQESVSAQFGAVMTNLDQQQRKTMQNINAASQKAATGMAFTAASAAESGVTGNAVLQSMNAYQQAEARASSIEFENYRSTMRQAQQNALAYRARAQSQLNRALPSPLPPVQLPAPVGAVGQPSMTPYVLNGIAQGITTGYGVAADIKALG